MIRRIRTLLTTALLSVALMTVMFAQSALAADLETGKKVFNANCAACHAKGGNSLVSTKTLKKDALTQNGKDTVEAIIAQVTNGKGSMPSFKSRLKAEQIESVALYVLDQANNNGW